MLLILIMMKTKLEKSEQKQKQEKRILTKLSKHSLLVGTSRENVGWIPFLILFNIFNWI